MQDKASLRRELRALSRSTLTSELRERGSASIVSQLLEHPLWSEAKRIGLYMALSDEPSLDAILRQPEGKEFFLPRVLDGETMAFFRYEATETLERSESFGLLEPKLTAEAIPPSELDLVVIPALGYDTYGYRLGRGKGYYDRYLAGCSAPTIGVTFALRPIERLPHDPWDRPVGCVLSPVPSLL